LNEVLPGDKKLLIRKKIFNLINSNKELTEKVIKKKISSLFILFVPNCRGGGGSFFQILPPKSFYNYVFFSQSTHPIPPTIRQRRVVLYYTIIY